MLELDSKQQQILLEINRAIQRKTFFNREKRSFYIHGGTGSGKTTAVENFALNCTKPLLFMHFHDYLLDITRLSAKMPLEKIVKLIYKNFKIVCFDEFFIESIADAKVLHDIFHHLIKCNIGIILTSNFKPENLYKDGFNRNLAFPAFSDFLYEKMNVIAFENDVDYRTISTNTKIVIAFDTLESFTKKFKVLPIMQSEMLSVDLNHDVEIIGRFLNGVIIDYNLFQKYSSIKDYRYLARKFEHIHVTNMQSFHENNEDEAIRFRNFVDILYMRSTILTWNGSNNKLFPIYMLENIKFKRCSSRLIQMETQEYITSQNLSFKRKANINASIFFENLLQ